MERSLYLTLLVLALLSSGSAYAANEKGASTAVPSEEEVEEGNENKRVRTLEGSPSRYSGQFDLTYFGSTINDPLSEHVPNSGKMAVPPVSSLTGTASLRYRIDYHTTAGVGVGLTTQTPFQGPKRTTVANPYVDLAHSFRIGPIPNRSDLRARLYTDARLHQDYGEGTGFSALDEAYYRLNFDLTCGITLAAEYNTFINAPIYEKTFVHRGQVAYDFRAEPYFEYPISKKTSLRSVVGFRWDHTRALANPFSFYSPLVYQTLGVGIAFTRAQFLYVYLRGYPYSGNLGVKTTTLGFNAIINMF
jgi:hypothetical protein